MQFLSFLKKTFSLDDRSLALYRVLIGILVMADVIYRLEDITNFYTDVGLVPRSIFTGEMTMPWSFSLHLANGSFLVMAIFFAIHFLLGLMVTVGYKTRWAVLGSFVMAVSVHNRNWLVNNGGDDVFRAILFLSIFLPLGRRFSIDSGMQKEPSTTKEFFSTWSLAFFLQVFVIYFVSYILKDHPIWRSEYSATFYSSRLDIFTSKLGYLIRDLPTVLKGITFFSIYLEWLGPLLLVFAFAFGRFWWVLRTILVVLFIGFHFGIFLTMNIGLFTFICMAMWTIFLPGPFWDKLASIFGRQEDSRLVINYDGECGFCQKGVRILKSFLLNPEVAIVPAQDTPSIYKDMLDKHSWVIVNGKGERFFHYNAWLELLRHSMLGRPFLFFFGSKPISFIGGKVYHWVSHNRPLMGKASQFLDYRAPKKEITTLKWLFELSGAFLFVTLLMWNLTTIKKWNIKAPLFQNVTRWLHLYQEWNMFAPFPKTDNVWVEIPAVLGDGTEMELITGQRDIYSVKDQAFYKAIPNEHWRKFYLNVSERTDYARYYGGFLCRQWNDRKIRKVPNTTLRKFEIIVYSQPNLPTGEKGGINRKLSWKHWCFDEDFKKENL